MRLILVRHAKAFDRDAAAWPLDAKRPLTAEGRKAFIRLAKRMKRVVREVDLVESSGFVRAWQTAQLLHLEAKWPMPTPLLVARMIVGLFTVALYFTCDASGRSGGQIPPGAVNGSKCHHSFT